jgi:hypothetical protein
MGNQFWAVAWARPWEKGVWADSEQLFGVVFSIFNGQKKIYLRKTSFFRAKNATVSTLRSGTDYCWLYCETDPCFQNKNSG